MSYAKRQLLTQELERPLHEIGHAAGPDYFLVIRMLRSITTLSHAPSGYVNSYWPVSNKQKIKLKAANHTRTATVSIDWYHLAAYATISYICPTFSHLNLKLALTEGKRR